MSKRLLVVIRLVAIAGLSPGVALITFYILKANASRRSWRLDQWELAMVFVIVLSTTAFILYQAFTRWIEPRIFTTKSVSGDPSPEPTHRDDQSAEEFGRYNPLQAALEGAWGTLYSILGIFASLSIGYLLAKNDYWSLSRALVGSGLGGIGMVFAGSLAPIMIPALAYAIIRCVVLDRDQLMCLLHLTLLQSLNCTLSGHEDITVLAFSFVLLVLAFDAYVVWSLRKAALAGADFPVGVIRRTNGLIALFALFMICYVTLYVAHVDAHDLFSGRHSLYNRLLTIAITTLPCAFLLCFAAIDTKRTFERRNIIAQDQES